MINGQKKRNERYGTKVKKYRGTIKSFGERTNAVLSSNGTVMEIEVHRPIVVGK